MLTNGAVGPEQARALIASRPREGWADTAAFWAQPVMARVAVDPEARDQITVLTRFFDLRVDVELGGSRAVRTALLEARSDGRVHTVIQRWTPEE
jgi:general secretion pathway protein K